MGQGMRVFWSGWWGLNEALVGRYLLEGPSCFILCLLHYLSLQERRNREGTRFRKRGLWWDNSLFIREGARRHGLRAGVATQLNFSSPSSEWHLWHEQWTVNLTVALYDRNGSVFFIRGACWNCHSFFQPSAALCDFSACDTKSRVCCQHSGDDAEHRCSCQLTQEFSDFTGHAGETWNNKLSCWFWS